MEHILADPLSNVLSRQSKQHRGIHQPVDRLVYYSEWSSNGVSTCTVVLNSIKAVIVSGVSMACLHVRSC